MPRIPANPELPASWPAYAVLLPHARAVLPLTNTGIWTIAQALGHGGNYVAARDLTQQIAAAREEDGNYGPGHPNTIERVLGPEHPASLTDGANLAYWTGAARDAGYGAN